MHKYLKNQYSGAADSITFTLGAGSRMTLSSPELYNKRLTLVYEECDGMVRPELMLEGKMMAAGSLMEKGEEHILTMTVQSGNRTNVIENTLRAGGMYAIITDMQSITRAEIEKAGGELLCRSATASEKNIYTDEYLGVLLDYAGKMYFAQVDIADRMMAEELNVTQVRSLSVGMVGYSVATEFENGVITGISEGSLVTDIDLDFHMAVSNTGNAEDVKKYMLASGMMSSAYEGAIWEQITGIPSVSTVSILNEAKECGIPVLCITGENLEEALPGLSAGADVVREIRQEAAAGKMVIIPQENVTIGDWNGTGYIVLEPEHYTGRHMICGGIWESGSTSGGSTGVPVYLAYLVNLFMSSVDMAQSLGLVEAAIGAMELGGVIGSVLGIGILLLCVTLFAVAVEEYKTNMDNLFAYQSGEEQAGQEIIVNAAVNVAVTAAFSGAGYLAKKQAAKYAEKCVADKLGTELAQTLLKDGADSRAVSQAIKAMEKSGVDDAVIRKAAQELTAEEFSRVGRLTRKGLTQELLEKAVDNKAVLETVSDETFLLFQNSAKSADEIITVLERHGNEAGQLMS